MCGIAGFVSFGQRDATRCAATAALRLLRHRGPDDHGWLLSTTQGYETGRGEPPLAPADLILLHRRLSILDLSEAGWQPMGTPDGRWFIAFNGEIYNYVELRAELTALGHTFHSHGDTEVLLHALVAWGRGALERLTGMFAFAFLDRQKRTLLVGRDFFGIKPLYYARSSESFAFASEIKALHALSAAPRRVNPQRLYDYLISGVSDYGGETLFAGIQQLPPAHCLELHLDQPHAGQPESYWTLACDEPLDLSYDEATRRLRELFLDSVRLHLRSDVPVGAALSGGIDSSCIVGAIRHLEPKANLHAFSYVAGTPELSEERWVNLAAAKAGAIVHKVHATADDLVDDLDHLILQQEEPFGSSSIYVQNRVFRRAREVGITVMLDGQGADEMLGGYAPYLAARLASLLRQGEWSQAVRFLRHVARRPGSGGAVRLLLQTAGFLIPRLKGLAKQAIQGSILPRWLNAGWFEERGVSTRIDSGHVLGNMPHTHLLRQHLQRTLMESSLPQLLRYEDRNSMAYSIESRVPFLTAQLAEFLLRLPESFLIGPDGTRKRIFRDAMRGIAPDAVLDRQDKIGFATPERQWFGKLRPWVEKVLAGEAARSIPAFRHDALQQEWRELIENRTGFDFRAWRWVNVIRWAEQLDVRFG